MLTAVKCAGSSSDRAGVFGPRSIGISATTIGSSRTLLKPTAIATSISCAPPPSVEIRITCAGPAQTRSGRGRHPDKAETEIVSQRADADIGAEQHIGENRQPCRAHAAEPRGACHSES